MLINFIFNKGQRYKVEYLLCKKDEIKKCYFEGICIDNSTKHTVLVNKIKREVVNFLFLNNNPTIQKIKTIHRRKKNILKKIY